ncbi:helix-turn-helix transcriptional regulator [Actinoplanes sp. NPDC026670]|uniref:helix-turn-helix transcriptional regulator n=1 Tax=Actinoplanes sp. NPDC026670 TaxID=3154700 RepID=UPI00340A1199
MPRPNPARPIGGEAGLARRIAYERQRAGMSTESLAKRMTDLGCPINQSAVWKIENGDPPRRITYDEALAFAQVFGMPLEELSVPPELAADQEALKLLGEFRQSRQAMHDAFYRLAEHAVTHPRTASVLEEDLSWDDIPQDVVRDVFAKLRERHGGATVADLPPGLRPPRDDVDGQ